MFWAEGPEIQSFENELAERLSCSYVSVFSSATTALFSLIAAFDFHDFENRFGRIRDFESVASAKGWMFWTYARRASERFGELGRPILKQVSGHRGYVRRAVSDELERQISTTKS